MVKNTEDSLIIILFLIILAIHVWRFWKRRVISKGGRIIKRIDRIIKHLKNIKNSKMLMGKITLIIIVITILKIYLSFIKVECDIKKTLK